MKNTLAALLCSLGLVGAVHAVPAGLYVSGPSPTTFTTSGFNGITGFSGEQVFEFGTLTSSLAGTLTYTYLGSEAGHTDKFFSLGSNSFNNKSNVNPSFSVAVAAGHALDFSFKDVSANNMSIVNGASISGWGIAGNANSWQNTFGLKRESSTSYLLFYNDYVSGGDRDYDDMVVRVTLAPVPEPETYAMFLAGLGLMGAIARRRLQKA